MSAIGRSVTQSAVETAAAGAALGRQLAAGDIVWLTGELGAGKTVFAGGLLGELGARGPFSSPTFTIARRYDEAMIPLSHLDLYRLEIGLAGEDPGLLQGEFGHDRITLVEWPERGAGVLPDPTWRVELEHRGGDQRLLEISQ